MPLSYRVPEDLHVQLYRPCLTLAPYMVGLAASRPDKVEQEVPHVPCGVPYHGKSPTT